jgi:AraC-like DNA-binding protein
MEEIDGVIRGGAIGILLLIAAALLHVRWRQAIGWAGMLCVAGAIAYLFRGYPGISEWPASARLLLGILALSCPFFFWTLTRLIFEDGFNLRPVHWALLGVIVVAGVGQTILRGVWLPWLPATLRLCFRLLSLALIIHAFWIVWSGRTADLVEKRAQVRFLFLGVTGVGVAMVVIAALFYGPPAGRSMPARFAEAVSFLAVSLGLALVLMRIDDDFLSPANTIPSALPLAACCNPVDAEVELEIDRDADDLARLDSLMRNQEVWRETGITIGGLAARVGIPEYRLRRLINQKLGHRNFTAFLNEYRLAAAAARLTDRDGFRVPVLTIALDLGWGSIGPFNRAFRARFGMTPTDYRRAKAAVPGAQTLTDS